MILVLSPDPEQQQALETLLDAQQDPESPFYHQWLTPESFGQQFGVSDSDLKEVSGWLTGHGFQVDEISAGNRTLMFSGNVEQVENAFHTSMRHYNISGARHLANATEVSIPAALAPVILGIASLNDFRKQPMHKVNPDFTYGSAHYLAPADFATIYDVAALYAASFNGAGQSIAIVGRSNIAVSDVTLFRSTMGLPVNNPTVVLNGPNPGIQPGDQTEALLDVEWSGAVAQKAAVQLVVSASTNTTDGVDLSAQYIVNHNLAPVMSTSFGSCEAYMGSAENAFWNSLWSQAAAEGITAFVSAGDSGAAGCDSPDSSSGTAAAVSGLSSTAYNVAVGGTEFNDGANASQYWSPNTNASTYGSALSYIPETVWNESGAVSGGSGLWAGGGGASIIYAKPSWQAGAGVPNDSHRDVPDVSLSAAGHDGYLIVQDGGLGAVGGTSASSPSFAGLMALVLQKTNARQGNANPTLYGLATKQAAGGAAVFHDTTSGGNGVPGVTGFTAGAGYDRASGLGSVDALQLVNHWQDLVTTASPKVTLTASPAAITVAAGASGTTKVTSTLSNGFNAAFTLSASGLPTGVTASLSPASFSAPGSGTSTVTLTAASNAAPGTYSIAINGPGNGQSTAATVSVTISAPAHVTLTASPAAITVSAGSSGSTKVTSTLSNGFSAAVALSVTGLPSGVTATLAPTSFSAPGSGTSTVTLTAASNAAPGTYNVTINGPGSSLSTAATVSVTISAPAHVTLTASPSAISVAPGSSGTTKVTSTVSNGFSAAVSLSVTGLPSGVTATLAPTSFSAPGSGTSTVRLTAASNAAPGTYSIAINGPGSGQSTAATVSVTISAPAHVTLTASPSAISVAPGSSGTTKVTSALSNGFNAAVSLSVAGLPAGVTASLSPASFAAPGSGTSTVTLTAASNAAPGTYNVAINGPGSSLSTAATVSVTISAPVTTPPSLTLALNATTANLAQGGVSSLGLSVSGKPGAAVALSVSGLPSGVTATFTPASLPSPGPGTSMLNFSASPSAALTTSIVTVTATGGGITRTETMTLTVTRPFTATLSTGAGSVKAGAFITASLTANIAAGFNSPLTLTATGLPTGVTCTFSPASLSGAGNQTSTVKFTAASTAVTGKTNSVTLSISSGPTTLVGSFSLTVTK